MNSNERSEWVRREDRGDDPILADVIDRLIRHPEIDATEIEVRVVDSSVTLSGSVPARPQKWLAEQIVVDVDGVRDINNDLKVKETENLASGTAGVASGTVPAVTGPLTGTDFYKGMMVIGTDARRVGKIKEVRDSDFHVDRHLAVDLYIAFHSVQAIRDGTAVLEVSAERADEIGWTKAMEMSGRASGKPTQSEPS